jgi:hypothetical protein
MATILIHVDHCECEILTALLNIRSKTFPDARIRAFCCRIVAQTIVCQGSREDRNRLWTFSIGQWELAILLATSTRIVVVSHLRMNP